jgi:plastocyanin
MKLISIALVIGSLTLAACGSSDDNASSSSSTSTKSTASSSGGYGGAGNTTASTSSSTQKMSMYDNYFGPKTVSGKPGSTVKIALKNVGQREHNFKIDGQSKADADVEPGDSATVSVLIPKSGSVQFYCEYHKGLGMVGTVKSS